MKCLNCQNETTNPKFCSIRCAAIYNNKLFIKRGRNRKCGRCDTLVLSNRKFCPKCIRDKSLKDKSIQDVVYLNHHKSSAFALIRSQARSVAKELGWNSCKNCGYDKHIEVCHIKSISSFPLETKLEVVNSPDNIIVLCRNHHWEFDHGIIKL